MQVSVFPMKILNKTAKAPSQDKDQPPGGSTGREGKLSRIETVDSNERKDPGNSKGGVQRRWAEESTRSYPLNTSY